MYRLRALFSPAKKATTEATVVGATRLVWGLSGDVPVAGIGAAFKATSVGQALQRFGSTPAGDPSGTFFYPFARLKIWDLPVNSKTVDNTAGSSSTPAPGAK